MASNKDSGAAPDVNKATYPVTDAVAEVVMKAAVDAKHTVQAKTVNIKWPDGLDDSKVLSLEKLRETLDVKAPLFAGVCTANRWRAGKQISIKEFKEAVEAFSAAAMGKGEKKCSGT